MAPSAAAKPRALKDPVNPLVLLEEYAREDLVKESQSFLAMVERVAAGWGTEHVRQIAVLVSEPTDVLDVTGYARVGELLKDAADREKQVQAWFEPRKSLGFKLHRVICGRENTILEPLQAWLKKAKANFDTFKRREEQRRRDEEMRLAREAQLAEQERLQREAEQLASRGETRLAEQVMEQAIATPAPVITVASALPEIRGIATSENWKWRPLSGDTPEARARAVQLVPRDFLCLDEKKLNAHAKAHKGSARVPGIEFYDAGSVSVRG